MRAVKKFDNTKIGLTPEEIAVFRKLNTPQKVQDFVSAIPQNFEPDGDSCMSVREVLRTNRAHCIEGALVAALAFWIHGGRPLLFDIMANDRDEDHVLALFKHGDCWGAISKGNHAYVRYRDPVYRSIRELAMSYFHEYYNTRGEKTLRGYSRPFSLRSFGPKDWITGANSWKVAEALCEIPHSPFLAAGQEKILRPVDEIQMRITALTVHKK